MDRTERTDVPSEISLKASFTELLKEEARTSPFAIEKLVNRPVKNGDAFEARKAEFRATAAKEVA
jgi:hypothetical protein